MRPLLTASVLLAGWGCAAGHPPGAAPPAPAAVAAAPSAPDSEPLSGQQSVQIDFAIEIQPILARCTPCHFPGGTMYAALPFDRPETVSLLGEKLLGRIEDSAEQELVRRFLAQEIALRDRAPTVDSGGEAPR